MSVRLGGIAFLNARPLTVALDREPGPFAVQYGVPSRCAAELHAGIIDLGLIPSIEYARGPEPYCIVPGVGIVSRGPVLTVRLFWRGALERVRRVALDLSSRTSVALLQILLHERLGRRPELVEAAPDLEAMLAQADAALLIGDSVFRVQDGYDGELDLGQAWLELTGLPFVYAFWAGRPDALTPAQADHLIRARDLGRAQLNAVADTFALSQNGHGPEYYRRYFDENVRHCLGEEELAGLRTFYELAFGHGLIDRIPEVRFYPVTGDRSR